MLMTNEKNVNFSSSIMSRQPIFQKRNPWKALKRNSLHENVFHGSFDVETSTAFSYFSLPVFPFLVNMVNKFKYVVKKSIRSISPLLSSIKNVIITENLITFRFE